MRQQLSRSKVLPSFAQLPPGLGGVEASGGAHYGAREWGQLGHDGGLMAVPYLRSDRTNQKKDQKDAEAICAAVARPRTRGVPGKSEAPQAVLPGPSARDLLVPEGTARAQQSRGVVMEYGIVMAQGLQGRRRALPELLAAVETLLELGRERVAEWQERRAELARGLADSDHRLEQLATQHEAARRLRQVEGVGPSTRRRQ